MSDKWWTIWEYIILIALFIILFMLGGINDLK